MKQDTLEGKAKTKNGVKRLCFSIVCILLEVVFIITIVTRLNEYAEIINLFTRILSGILVLGLYASDKTSSMKMPWVILILIFPIMGVGLYLLIGLNGGTHKMRERYGPHLAVHIAAAPCPVLVNSVDGDALLHTARHLAAAVGSLGGRILT